METNIQEVFRLIREGNKNAFLELNINLRIFMNPDPEIGEITRIYNHYNIDDYTREEINSKIIMIIIEKILLTDKLNEMESLIELKWYSKRIAKILIDESFKLKKREGEIFESFDSYQFNDDGELIGIQFEGGVDVELVNYELEYAKLYDEISVLLSKKCMDLYKLVMKDLSSAEVLIELRGLGHVIKDKKNLASTKQKCKKNLIAKVRRHNKYSNWKEIFENN